VLVRSPVFTAWKRISIEKDRMFRQGGLLAVDGHKDVDNYVLVHDWANLPDCGDTPGPTPCFQIVVFDALGAAHSAEYSIDHPYVSHILPFFPNMKQIWLVDQNMNEYKLKQNYYRSSYPDFSDTGFSAGIGVIDSGYYEAEMASLSQAFNDAFVSFRAFPEGAGAVPYLPMQFFDGYEINVDCSNSRLKEGYDLSPWFRFSSIWFYNRSRFNTLQIIGAVETPQLNDCLECGGSHPQPQLFGISGFSDGLSLRMSYIFRGSLEFPCKSTAEWTNATGETTNHEIGHAFYVNPSDSGGHDNKCAWNYGPDPLTCPFVDPGTCNVDDSVQACLMNIHRDRWTTSHRFDGNDLICGDPICPNGNPGCCSGCEMEGNGSIRQLQDPLIGTMP
jgi:hypothetical protein